MRYISIFLLALFLLVAYAAYDAYTFLHTPSQIPGRDITFEVEKGATFDRVAWDLKKAGLIADVKRFQLLGRYEKALGSIKAGEYILSTALTPPQVLEQLVKGQANLVRLTIREGLTWWDTARAIEQQGFATYEDLKAVIHDPVFLKQHAIPFDTAEGFLFPDTYLLNKPKQLDREQAEYIASLLIKTFWQKNAPFWQLLETSPAPDENFGSRVNHISSHTPVNSLESLAHHSYQVVMRAPLPPIENGTDDIMHEDDIESASATSLHDSSNKPDQQQAAATPQDGKPNGVGIQERTQPIQNPEQSENKTHSRTEASNDSQIAVQTTAMESEQRTTQAEDTTSNSQTTVQTTPKTTVRTAAQATVRATAQTTVRATVRADTQSATQAGTLQANLNGTQQGILSGTQPDKQTGTQPGAKPGVKPGVKPETQTAKQVNLQLADATDRQAEDNQTEYREKAQPKTARVKQESQQPTEQAEPQDNTDASQLIDSSGEQTTPTPQSPVEDNSPRNTSNPGGSAPESNKQAPSAPSANGNKPEAGYAVDIWPGNVLPSVMPTHPPRNPSEIDADALRQAITLASLVEKETGLPTERPRVAGVYANRISKGMLLQCDPTIIYGIGPSFSGPIRRSQLRDASNLYNTYIHPGLPPSPISSFGVDAIASAILPEKHNYLYFVATGKGRDHVFSKTLSEHNKAVAAYRARMRNR